MTRRKPFLDLLASFACCLLSTPNSFGPQTRSTASGQPPSPASKTRGGMYATSQETSLSGPVNYSATHLAQLCRRPARAIASSITRVRPHYKLPRITPYIQLQ